MFDRFTDRARKVMGLARQAAQKFNHDYIGTEHILLGIVEEASGVGASALQGLDVSFEEVRAEIKKLVSHGTTMVTMGQLPFTPRAKKVLELSLEEASNLGHTYIGSEHLLLGLIREDEGVAAQALRALDVKLDDVREEILDLLGAEPNEPLRDDDPIPGLEVRRASQHDHHGHALQRFGRDLVALARNGDLPPVVGRVAEMDRILMAFQLVRRVQPVLVGAHGVGKTAIVHGLAARIVAGDIPDTFPSLRLIELDLTRLTEGTQYHGVMEGRMLALIEEADRAGDVAFVLDWRPTTFGTEPESVSHARSIAADLACRDLRLLSCATPEQYADWTETRPVLKHYTRPLPIDPPTAEETLDILQVWRGILGDRHVVAYTDDAVRAAVDLSLQHLVDRPLPASAIQVLDAAGAQASFPDPYGARIGVKDIADLVAELADGDRRARPDSSAD